MRTPHFTAERSLYHRTNWRPSRRLAGQAVAAEPQLRIRTGGSSGCNEGCRALCDIQFDLDEQDCWDQFKLYSCVEAAERKHAICLDNCGCGPIIAFTSRFIA